MDPHDPRIIQKPRPRRLTNKVKKFLCEWPVIFYSFKLDFLMNLAKFKKWRNDRFRGPYFVDDFALYDHLAATYFSNVPIDYLEFGVSRGRTMGHWLATQKHPDSRFCGFDSFEGLPEPWKLFSTVLDKGHFTAKGKFPSFEDSRVQFVKGWFQDSLPGFLKTFTCDRQLVVNVDCDLYSSSLFVVCSLHPFLKPGSIVLFDEFSYPLDEFRVLDEYCSAYLREYEVLAAAGEYFDQVAIRFTK